jgi:ferredoxin
MADPDDCWPENAAGPFFVDRGCIDCDLCRSTAPDNFRRSPLGYSFVGVQPRDEREARDCRQALADCPVEAIGERDAPR